MFQSSPAPKGWSHVLGQVRGRDDVFAFQSSPAPKGGSHDWASLTPPLILPTFQSSPAPKGGSHRVGYQYVFLLRLVSILSRPEGREPRLPDILEPRDLMFQSSPAPKGGSHQGCPGPRPQTARFQSSPAPKGGSHAARGPAQAFWYVRFNPLPPRRAGATSGFWAAYPSRIRVSILSRPEGREPQA